MNSIPSAAISPGKWTSSPTVPRERIDDVFLFVAEDSAIDVSFHAGQSGTPLQPSKTAAASPTASTVTVAAPKPALAPTPPIAVVQPAAPPPPTMPPRATAAAASSPAPRSSPRIRVDADQLDDLVGLAGELAVLSDNLQGLREVPGAERWVHTLEVLERVSRQVAPYDARPAHGASR